ncbi:hypothetical protein B0H12DRAFT_1138818 [Mycena haematopus]|nr:hypothetical protein B0H12DRAFT_1138818 [Mycena haematopus]
MNLDPNEHIPLPLPPQIHRLPPGIVDDLAVADDALRFEQLYNHLWATRRADIFKRSEFIVPLDGFTVVDEQNTSSFSACFLRLSKSSYQFPLAMLVRDEYETIATMLETKFATARGRGGCVLLGHSGLGKSTFLSFLMVHRLCNGHNTYVCKTDGFYCFTTLGFKHFITHGEFTRYLSEEKLDKKRAMLLFDTNESVPPPKPHSKEYWPVIVTSPATHSYKEWQKQVGATHIWMKPWSWEEIYVTGQTLHGQEHELLWKVFCEMGPSIRLADRVLSGSLDVVRRNFDAAVDAGLIEMKMGGTQLLRRALHAIHTGTGSTKEFFPSAISMLKPVDEVRRAFTVDTVTRSMADRVLSALEEATESEQLAFANLFSSTSALVPPHGNLFKARVIRFLRKKLVNTHIDYCPRFLPPKSSSNSGPDDPAFKITIPQNTTFYDVEDVSTFKPPRSPFVLIPAKPNQPTWDFLVCVADQMLICQASTHPDDSLIMAGLDDVTAIAGNKDHRLWKIVFIVPQAVAPSWTTAMTVTKGKAKKFQTRSTKEYEDIEQYVLGFDFI